MTTKTVGKLVKLTTAIGVWPVGSLAKVIPAPYKTIPYSKVNSTGERKEFVEAPEDKAIWIIMSNPDQIDAHPKFPVYENEIEEFVRDN